MLETKVFTFDTKDLKKSKNGLQRLLKKGYEVKNTLVVNDVVIYTLSTNVDDIRDFILKHVPMGAERTKVNKYWLDCAIKSSQRYFARTYDSNAQDELYKYAEYTFGDKNNYWVVYVLDAITKKDRKYDKPVEEYYPILNFLGFDIVEEK